MREIGSEFWEVPILEESNGIFPEGTKWFLSGRIALKYIIQDIKKKKKIQTVALPSWCCDSMIIPFIQENIEVLFYQVYVKNGELVQVPNVIADMILVIDYFGFSTQQDFDDYPGIVIRDLTHSIMSNTHNDAQYYFGSLRKWCGISTGGFAYGDFSDTVIINTTDKNYINLRRNAMLQKKAYIDGLTSDKDYLNSFATAEKVLDKTVLIVGTDDEDVEHARHMDVKLMKTKRRSNLKLIQKELFPHLMINEFSDNDCPLFVPIIVNNRDLLKKYLINQKIYCPVHWPVTTLHKLNTQTVYVYSHELSVVCDQRYSEKEMEYMCSVIKEGIKICCK